MLRLKREVPPHASRRVIGSVPVLKMSLSCHQEESQKRSLYYKRKNPQCRHFKAKLSKQCK
ncbi:hypothetical protein DNTS_000532 [Danionella cerebrum]|uniref:Uncharacterized protein n=1 Tax=Danionella cerebrum TaxID=2873325 RepID=A0A553PVW0_9TELE|nr:hypothetical protein DNTS_000532 [Danionella translucida]